MDYKDLIRITYQEPYRSIKSTQVTLPYSCYVKILTQIRNISVNFQAIYICFYVIYQSSYHSIIFVLYHKEKSSLEVYVKFNRGHVIIVNYKEKKTRFMSQPFNYFKFCR